MGAIHNVLKLAEDRNKFRSIVNVDEQSPLILLQLLRLTTVLPGIMINILYLERKFPFTLLINSLTHTTNAFRHFDEKVKPVLKVYTIVYAN